MTWSPQRLFPFLSWEGSAWPNGPSTAAAATAKRRKDAANPSESSKSRVSINIIFKLLKVQAFDFVNSQQNNPDWRVPRDSSKSTPIRSATAESCETNKDASCALKTDNLGEQFSYGQTISAVEFWICEDKIKPLNWILSITLISFLVIKLFAISTGSQSKARGARPLLKLVVLSSLPARSRVIRCVHLGQRSLNFPNKHL